MRGGVNRRPPTLPGSETANAPDRAIEPEALAPVFRRSMLWAPERQASSAWIEHVPFAFWLVDVLRPGRIVELGTHNGVSYSAICQAVKTLGLATSCFAIDTWKGDEHAGFYEEDVYRDFSAFHDQRYGSFSQLVRSGFDDALPRFEDGSVDLLHIDGLHTYEAVRHDYQSWLPKLSANAVVLFHDTDVREGEFGVFRLWDEITPGKLNFSFMHGHGLGVLGEGRDYSDALHMLFDANGDERRAGAIRETFETLGRSVRALSERPGLDQALSDRNCEIDRLAGILTERAAEIAGLRRTLSERTGEVGKLREAPSEHDRPVGAPRQAVSERAHEIATPRQAAAVGDGHPGAPGAAVPALNASIFPRIVTPLRIISRGARRFWRASRRVAGFVSGVSAACLRRATARTLPHYRKYVPERIRRLVSAHLPANLKRPFVLNRTEVVPGYESWILQNEKLTEDDRDLIRAHIDSFGKKPKFSILMPVYNTPAPYLREAIGSIVSQLYQEWELCIADDASTSAEVGEILRSCARTDDRIKVRFRDANGGISACSNTALEMATGDWIVLADHDDTLAEHALYLVAEAVNRDPNLAIVYSDEDHIDEKGWRSCPYFKPDWDYDLFLGQNMISHLGAYRADLAREVGGFREGFEGSQDWDFALRVLEASGGAGVHHVPFVLYHWRQTSRTFSQTSKALACDAAQRAVRDHLTRTGQAAEATPSPLSGFIQVRRFLPMPQPMVSVIVPTKGQSPLLRTCIDGLVKRTSYKNLEIVIVDNGSTGPDARAFLAGLRRRPGFVVLEDKGEFNFSRLVNRGVAASSGEICVLLNDGVDVINAGWLDELAVHALRSEVGAVGAKLYYADDTLQHGGVTLGIDGVAALQHRHAPRGAHGYFGRLQLTHSVSCVTAACLAVRRAVYDEVGGFDEKNLSVAFNDVDFCIRVREAGYQIIWTPHAELYHHESRLRGHEETPDKAGRFGGESGYMRDRWGDILDNDPFYNPNLSLRSDFFEIAETSRVRKPWLAAAGPAAVRTENARRIEPVSRADQLLAPVNRSARIIEIGPSYNPIAPKAAGWNTTTVDHATRSELVRKYASHPVDVSRIEEVDFVWTGGPLADAVPRHLHGAFDAFIASHVIEHTTDIVGFLDTAETLLAPGGIVILAIPDKRYCFDYFRPLTTTGEVLSASASRRSRHTHRAVFDHVAYIVMNDGNGAWGQAPVGQVEFVHTLDEADRAFSTVSDDPSAPYMDTHAWQFTPASFELLLLELARLGKTDWRIQRATPAMGCEFHAWLRRGGKAAASVLSQSELNARRLALLKQSLLQTREQIDFLLAGDPSLNKQEHAA